MKRKRKFLRFYSLKVLANYLGYSEDYLLLLIKNHPNCYRFRPGVLIRGKKRDFYVAGSKLKKVLKSVEKIILDRLTLPGTFHGGIKGKSLRTNALVHSGCDHILSLDIRNFYPSIKPEKVCNEFRKIGFGEECAESISKLTTVDNKTPHLPQGFCTSPKISALVLRGFEHRLHKLAQKHNLRYTFWIDDITISGHFKVGKFKNTIIKMLTDEGFSINNEKIKILTNSGRLVVNGVVINKHPNIVKEKRDEIKNFLFTLKIKGPKAYLNSQGKTATDTEVERLRNSLLGFIHYALGINRELGENYKRKFFLINWDK